MTLIDELTTAEVLSRFIEELGSYEPKLMDEGQLRTLRESAIHDRLTLVLGAGVSRSVGLPLWPGLVRSLVEDLFPVRDELAGSVKEFLLAGSSDPLRQVANLEQLLGYRSSLLRVVQRCLYKDYDPSLEVRLLEPLCKRLLLTPPPMRVHNVITYNFDCTLENCLTRLGGPDSHMVVCDSAGLAKAKRGLKVFHPHGYLPAEHEPNAEANLVFAEGDYFDQYAEWSAWTNVVQLHHMNSRRCLFLGLSISDPNMRRLLSLQRDVTQPARHISVQIASKSNVANYFQERQLSRLGVGVLWVSAPEEVKRVIEECFG